MPVLRNACELPTALLPWLENELNRLVVWGEISKPQRAAILAELTPMLPCYVKVCLRSPKSIVYVQAGTRSFRIGQRAQLIDKPWRINPKPRATRRPGDEWL